MKKNELYFTVFFISRKFFLLPVSTLTPNIEWTYLDL